MPENVNVSSSFLDKILTIVQSSIKPEILDKVTGPGPEIQDKLGTRAETSGPFARLDLVSHSFGVSHLLLLGDGKPDETSYLIDDSSLNAWMTILCNGRMKAIIQRLGISQLRLLGCLTAFTPDGRKAMNKLKSELSASGVNEVFGTKHYLSAADFDQGGFKDEPAQSAKLLSCTQIGNGEVPGPKLPDLPPAAQGVLGLALDAVPAVPEKELQKLAQLKGFVPRSRLLDFGQTETEHLYDAIGKTNRTPKNNGKSLPGLLAVPVHEYWIRAQGIPDQYRLLHVFFDWQMLCVYSPRLMINSNSLADELWTHSALYPVADPKAFKNLMTTLGSQIPIPPAQDLQ